MNQNYVRRISRNLLARLHSLSTHALLHRMDEAYKTRDEALRVPLKETPVRATDPTSVVASPVTLLAISRDDTVDEATRTDASLRYARWDFAQSEVSVIKSIVASRKAMKDYGTKFLHQLEDAGVYTIEQRAHIKGE